MKNHIVIILAVLAALTNSACVGKTTQHWTKTINGERFVEKSEGPNYEHTTITEDTTYAYRECMRRVNVQKLVALNPDMTADFYCRCMTTPTEQQPPECDMLMYSTGGGMSMMGGGGYMEGSSQPTYYVPAGPSDYEGTVADPRVSSRVVDAHEAERRRRSSKDDDDIKPVARQVADNATEIREAQERLDRMEAERSQKE